MHKPIRVAIANSDHSFVNELVAFLRSQPHIQVIGTAFDGPGAIEMCVETLPDVVLLGLHLSGVDGIRTARSILRANAQTGVLIIAPDQTHGVDEYALQAMKIGAKGYLPNSALPEIVAQAIQQIHEGGVYIPAELAPLILDEFDPPLPPDSVLGEGVFDKMTEAQQLPGLSTLERLNRQVQTSVEVAQDISAAPALDDLFQRVVHLVQKRFGYYHAHVYALEGDNLVMQEGTGEAGWQMKKAHHRIPLTAKRSLVARAARSGDPVLVPDVSQTPDWLPNPLLPETKSEIAVPIKLGVNVLGVLDVQNDTVGGLGAEDQLLLTGLCGQIAVAMNNHRLEDERKVVEVQLRQLSQAVEQSANTIIITNLNGYIEYANPKFAETTGYTLKETIGQHTRILKSGETSSKEYKTMWKSISAGHDWRGEFHNKRKNGELYWEAATISPIKNAAGEITHYLAVKEDITRRKEAEEALAKRVSEMETVAQVSIAASTILETDKLLQKVVDLTKERFALYHAHIYLLNWSGDMLELTAGAGEVGRKLVAQEWRIPYAREQSLVAQAARTRRGVIVNDVRADSNFLPNPLLPDTHSEMAVPMMVGSRVLGVLDVQADTVDHFTDEDARIHTTLAAQIATALENARLFEQTEAALKEAESLRQLADQSYQASADLNTARSYDDVLAVLRRHTLLGQDAQNVSLDFFDRPWTEDQIPEWINVPARWTQLPTKAVSARYPVAAFPAAGELLQPDAPTLIEDVASDPRLDDNTRALYAQRFGAKSTIFVPLVAGGQWIGFVNGIYQQPTKFQESNVRRLSSLAGQAAVVVQAIRQLEETTRRARREHTIRQITEKMRTATSLKELVTTTTMELGEHLAAGHAVLELGFESGERLQDITSDE